MTWKRKSAECASCEEPDMDLNWAVKLGRNADGQKFCIYYDKSSADCQEKWGSWGYFWEADKAEGFSYCIACKIACIASEVKAASWQTCKVAFDNVSHFRPAGHSFNTWISSLPIWRLPKAADSVNMSFIFVDLTIRTKVIDQDWCGKGKLPACPTLVRISFRQRPGQNVIGKCQGLAVLFILRRWKDTCSQVWQHAQNTPSKLPERPKAAQQMQFSCFSLVHAVAYLLCML